MKNVLKQTVVLGLFGIILVLAFVALPMTSCEQPSSPKPSATCVAEGIKTRTCALDASYKETEAIPINPAAHDWGGWTQTKAPTLTEEGEQIRKCVLCQEEETEILAPIGHVHQWGEWTPINLAGTEERACAVYSSHIEQRLTGTGRFSFQLISGSAAYRVSKRTAIAGTVRIPDLYRPSDEVEFQPVTAISDSAFSNCTSLTGIIIPAGVTSVGNQAFSGCIGLTNITVDADNPSYASESGVLYNKTKTNLLQAPEGISGTVTIPEGVTTISDEAFSGCTGITSITIPADVTEIGSSAFSGCTSLASITLPFVGNTLNGTTNTSFSYIFGTVPASLKTVTITGGDSIAQGAFSNCRSLTSITIPNSVTTLGNGSAVFHNWSAEQTIYIKGYASEAAATAPAPNGWGTGWLTGCNAVRKYWNGSSYQ